jgi:putative transposase
MMSRMEDRGRRFPKRIRLPLEAYAEAGSVWHITIRTARHQPHFANPALASMVCEQLRWYGNQYDLTLFGWCLMPDHLHLIAQVNSRSLIAALDAFKSWTTRQSHLLGVTGQLWQTSFHDHGLRNPADIDAAVGYLYRNPIRSGLVEHAEDYPWTGGVALERET